MASCSIWKETRQIIPRQRLFVCLFVPFKRRSVRAHKFDSLGQGQSTVASRAETNVEERSLIGEIFNRCRERWLPSCTSFCYTDKTVNHIVVIIVITVDNAVVDYVVIRALYSYIIGL